MANSVDTDLMLLFAIFVFIWLEVSLNSYSLFSIVL